jgi:hypothetical protein
MARYTTYKSGIVSSSGLVSTTIAASAVFGTASYALNAVSASFAKNASGSWLSSSFGTSLSALSVIGFGVDGNPLTVFPAQDSLYLTVVNGNIGWSSLDSTISSVNYTEDSVYTNGFQSSSFNFSDPESSTPVGPEFYLDFSNTPNVFDFQTKDFIVDTDSFQILNLAGSSLYTFDMIASYTTSSI